MKTKTLMIAILMTVLLMACGDERDREPHVPNENAPARITGDLAFPIESATYAFLSPTSMIVTLSEADDECAPRRLLITYPMPGQGAPAPDLEMNPNITLAVVGDDCQPIELIYGVATIDMDQAWPDETVGEGGIEYGDMRGTFSARFDVDGSSVGMVGSFEAIACEKAIEDCRRSN